MIKKLLLILLLLIIPITNISSRELSKEVELSEYYEFSQIGKHDYTVQFQLNKVTNELRVIYQEPTHIQYDEGRVRNYIYIEIIEFMINHNPRFYHYRLIDYKLQYNKVLSNHSVVTQVTVVCNLM